MAGPNLKSMSREGLVAGLALCAFAVALFAPRVLSDGDTFWHVTVGEWILGQGRPPRVDIWSYTKAGTPWVAHEWLSEALLGGAFRWGGWGGVMLLGAAAYGLAAWILGRRLARDLGGIALIVVMVLALNLTATSLLVRPHLLALPILAAWAAGLLAARDRDGAPSLWLLPLMTLWANLHGGYAFGLALIGPFALEALVAAPAGGRLRVVRGWGLFGLAALVAALITPFGLEGLILPVRLLAMKNLGGIGEWRPETFGGLPPMEQVLLALLALALLAPIRLPVLRLLLLIGLIHMSLSQVRHQILLAIVGPMLLAEPIAKALTQDARDQAGVRIWPALAAGLGAAALAAVRLAIPYQPDDSAVRPIAALAAVPEAVRRQPVLNDYAFGGYLISRGVRPFIDGRAEVYGDAFLDRYAAVTVPDRKALERELRDNGVGWTIFAPSQPVVALMNSEPGWRRAYADRYAVVHVRTIAP